MQYNGKDVTYALFKARNDQLKLLIKSRRQDDRLKRIIATQTPPQGDYSRAVATKIGGRKNAFTVVKFTAWGQDSKGKCFIDSPRRGQISVYRPGYSFG